MYKKSALLILSLAVWSGGSGAVDRAGIELGAGDASTKLARVHLQWNWDRSWFTGASWQLTGYWDASLGYWDGGGAGSRSLAEIALTPVFRLQRSTGQGLYFEAAIGAHLLSRTRIDDDHAFGTSFQFGDHLGLGCVFGADGRNDVGFRFQHVSNGGLAQPNDGINFAELLYTTRF
jgi:lipid A 3-O-deacylase